MGTRSMIGRRELNGAITGIYCHWDGYLAHNGAILAEHYTDPRKVDALIAIGDLSSLGSEIGEAHNFDSPPKGQCNAYGRDRGEKGTRARTFSTEMDFATASGAEFAYVFERETFAVPAQWFVSTDGGKSFHLLTDALRDAEVA